MRLELKPKLFRISSSNRNDLERKRDWNAQNMETIGKRHELGMQVPLCSCVNDTKEDGILAN